MKVYIRMSKMRAVIRGVKEKAREWKDDMHIVEGMFEDGSAFSMIVTGAAKADSKIAELAQLIGKDGEYEVNPKDDYKGQKQWKLLSWPGKPERPPFMGGGGRGGERPTRYRDTEQAFHSEQEGIHRSVALRESVAYCVGIKSGNLDLVVSTAEKLFQWLSSGKGEDSTFTKYVRAISDAAKAGDSERLAKLRSMIVESHSQGRLTGQDAHQLEGILEAAKPAQSQFSREYDRMVAGAQTDQRRLPEPMAELESRF